MNSKLVNKINGLSENPENRLATTRFETKKTMGEGNGLTAKQEKFALSVAQGMTQADAYRAAYSAEKMKSETIQANASRLMADSKIAARVGNHRAAIGSKMAEVISYEYEDAMIDLDDAVAFAKSNGSSAAYVAALNLKQKISGLHVEDRKNNRSAVDGLDYSQTKSALEALAVIKKARQIA